MTAKEMMEDPQVKLAMEQAASKTGLGPVKVARIASAGIPALARAARKNPDLAKSLYAGKAEIPAEVTADVAASADVPVEEAEAVMTAVTPALSGAATKASGAKSAEELSAWLENAR